MVSREMARGFRYISENDESATTGSSFLVVGCQDNKPQSVYYIIFCLGAQTSGRMQSEQPHNINFSGTAIFLRTRS